MSRPSDATINPNIVRSYDIRGRVGDQLTAADSAALGVAFACAAQRRGCRAIGVCRDGRLSSPLLESALVGGLLKGGMRVHAVGLGPTPLLHYAVRAWQLDGGLMVTGSHNPPDENGFKLLLQGEPVFGAPLQELVQLPLAGTAPGYGTLHASAAATAQITEEYVRHLLSYGAGLREPRVVWDCGNGAVGAVIGPLTGRLPGKHILLNAQVDGSFPAHHPDPAVAGNLRQLQRCVLQNEAEVGFAFDGDGDRIGIVDSSGEILWPDQLLLLLASEALADHPGAAIVGDVKCSSVLFEGIRQLGGRAVMAPSGYVRVRQIMALQSARVAGEMSGHILFADCWHRTDDALYAAMRVLRILARSEMSLAEFRANLPQRVATPELRL
ncbi:MAG: phosphomannomutase/phosphoglucomutase, partial [Sinobacteraceae bacterium]|nr:phosphomannomutase/phosphoglucomutase [Nevskiaceae bacterium]